MLHETTLITHFHFMEGEFHTRYFFFTLHLNKIKKKSRNKMMSVLSREDWQYHGLNLHYA